MKSPSEPSDVVIDEKSPTQDSQNVPTATAQQSSPPHYGTPAAPRLPNGRRPLGAWLCAAGSACSLFIGFGLFNAFGILENYYLANELSSKTPSDIAWIGSVEVGCLLAGNLLAGPLLDRIGPKPLMIYQMVMFPISCMLTSVSKKYYQFLLAEGILQGLSLACSFSVPIACNTLWFIDNKPLGGAIPVAASALGGILWPVIIRSALMNFGLGWTWRMIGFIGLALGIFTTLTVRLPPKPPSAVEQKKPPQSFFYLQAYKSVPYAFLQLAFFAIFLGIYYPIVFLPTIGAANGMSSNLQDYSISILNATSLIGRFFLPLPARWIGPLNMLCMCIMASAVIALSSINVTSTPSLLIIGAFYGCFSGAIFSLMSPCVAGVIPDVRRVGTGLGQLSGFSAVMSLLGSPIAGWIIHSSGGFDAAAGFAGGCLMLGLVLCLAAKFAANRHPFGIA